MPHRTSYNAPGKGSRQTLRAHRSPQSHHIGTPISRGRCSNGTKAPCPYHRTQRPSRTALASVGLLHAAHVKCVCCILSAARPQATESPLLPRWLYYARARPLSSQPLTFVDSRLKKPGTDQAGSVRAHILNVALGQVVNWGQRVLREEETLMLCPAGALLCSDGGWCVESYIHTPIPSLNVGDTDTQDTFNGV